MDERKPSGKSFDISKQEVMDAWKQVKANGGAPGVDGQSIEDFEADLKNNLYKIWNRMSSGSYMAPPVRQWKYQSPRRWSTNSRHTHCGGQGCSDGGRDRLVKEVEPIFHETPTGTGPAGRPMTPWGNAGSAAGSTTGCSISTSGSSSTAFRGISSSRRWRPIPRCLGDSVRETVACGPVAIRMAPSRKGAAEPPRDQRSHPCWQTCSCITGSIGGWPGNSRRSRSSGTSMTP